MCNAQETAIRHLSGQQVVSGIEIDRGVFADDVLLFSEHLPREIEAADIHKLYRVLGDHPALRDCMGNPDNPGGSLGCLVHQRRGATPKQIAAAATIQMIPMTVRLLSMASTVTHT